MKMQKFNQTPWWESDNYSLSGHNNGPDMGDPSLWGPNGPAILPLFKDGRTGAGWGLQGADGKPGFMEKYRHLEFAPRRVLYGVDRGAHDWAWIMRGTSLVCLDIDGKNGGLQGIFELDPLPETCAETSKSGNGFHLFYQTDDIWDPVVGFGKFADRIGVVQGVDFRGTGCVYHYPTQRWNGRAIAPLPDHVADLLLKKQAAKQYNKSVIRKTLELDEMEILMMHHELIEELKKPIPSGRRNNTLYAIGTDMVEAQIDGWEDLIADRAAQLGLDDLEIDKLIANIKKYGPTP